MAMTIKPFGHSRPRDRVSHPDGYVMVGNWILYEDDEGNIAAKHRLNGEKVLMSMILNDTEEPDAEV